MVGQPKTLPLKIQTFPQRVTQANDNKQLLMLWFHVRLNSRGGEAIGQVAHYPHQLPG